MFINKDSIKAKTSGMNDYLSLGDYLVDVKFEYAKLWSSDSGRNLAGSMTGTLIGIYPKLTLQFAPLTKTQFETISGILDAPRQSLIYYDPTKKQNVTIDTYTGDYGVLNKNIIENDVKNDGFSCSFISVNKRV